MKRDIYFEKLKTEKIQSDQNVEWKCFGPSMSGYCERFWCHPSDPNVMLTSPDMHVSFGTWDRGHSWQTIKDCDGLGNDMKRVLDVEFSRQNPDFAIAIDWNGWVSQTTNRGKTWEKISEVGKSYKEIGVADPNTNQNGWYFDQEGTRHDELAVDPSDDNIWYIGAGNFWDVKAVHKSLKEPNGQTSFIHVSYGYVAKSTDKGKTWTKYSQGLPSDCDVCRIIVHPENGQNIIMATNYGLYHSFDGGNSWEKKSKGLPYDLPRDLTSYYNEETGEFILYLVEQTFYEDLGDTVSSTGGIYKSLDFGMTWQSITGNFAFDLSEIHSDFLLEQYYRTLGYWFSIGDKSAKEKFTVLPKSIIPVLNFIAVNPNNPEEIYVSLNTKHDFTFSPSEVFSSMDGGKTWEMCARLGRYWHSGVDNEYWKSIGQESSPNMRFAHLQPFMDNKDELSGNRFVKINCEGDIFIQVNQQTLMSSNHGKTWEQIDDYETSENSGKWVGRGASDLPGRFILHETGIKSRRLLCCGEHGLWQTCDTGDWKDKQAVVVEQIEGQIHDTHKDAPSAHSISTVAVHPKDPNIIYILMWRQENRGCVRRTLDGGKTWENISQIFDSARPPHNACASQYSLLIDPINPENMYLCSEYCRMSEVSTSYGPELTKGEYGVYRSSDAGYNWEPINNGLSHDNFNVRRIEMDYSNPNKLYAALTDDNGGLYVTENRGDLWTKMDLPDEIGAVNSVFYNKTNHELLICTGTDMGAYEKGGVYRSRDDGKTWEKIFKAPYVWNAVSSTIDPSIVMTTVPRQKVISDCQFINPGIYISQDDAENWTKINKGLGQPNRMVEISLDPYNKDVIWSSAWGCGWFVAYLNNSKEPWNKED
ncbi:MAG: hypothetical protein R3Y33_04920 [Clostridia bacterium]